MRKGAWVIAAILGSVAVSWAAEWCGRLRLACSADGRVRIAVSCSGESDGSWQARLFTRDDSGGWARLWELSIENNRPRSGIFERIWVEGPGGVRLRTYHGLAAARPAGDASRARAPQAAYEISSNTRFRLYPDRLYLETSWGERICLAIPSGKEIEPADGDGLAATSLDDLAVDPAWLTGRRLLVAARLERGPTRKTKAVKGWIAAEPAPKGGSAEHSIWFAEGVAEVEKPGLYQLEVESDTDRQGLVVRNWKPLAEADLGRPEPETGTRK